MEMELHSHWSTPSGRHDVHAKGKRAQRAYAEMRLHEKERIRRELMRLSYEDLSHVETRIEHNIPHLDLTALGDPGIAPVPRGGYASGSIGNAGGVSSVG